MASKKGIFDVWSAKRRERVYRASAAGKSSRAWRTRKMPFSASSFNRGYLPRATGAPRSLRLWR